MNEVEARTFTGDLNDRLAKEIILVDHEAVTFSCSYGIVSLLEKENYICRKLKLKKLEDYYSIKPGKKNNYGNKNFVNSLEMILIDMAKQARDLAKINKCNDCGFESKDKKAFTNNECSKCGSSFIELNAEKVVIFGA